MANSTLEMNSRIPQLKELIKEKAFIKRQPPEEPFELASGDTSYVYFDCKRVTQNPEALNLIAEWIFARVKNYDIDAIGGLEAGAIPISTAVALLSYQKHHPIPSFWIRQRPKEHGTKNWIEGDLKPNSRVVVLDDVTTRGGSVEKALSKIQELDCKVVEIIAMIDREEGAKAKFAKMGYKFTSIFKMSDFTE